MHEETDPKQRAHARGREKAKAGTTAGYWQDFLHCLANAIGWPAEVVLGKIMDFHRERIDAVPDLTRYPELRGARELLLEEYRGMADAGWDDATIALSQSLHFWRATRLYQETGHAYYAEPAQEKCRVLYLPESDRGALHAKNIDDPLTYWSPRAPYPPRAPWPHPHPLWCDGVGSGLHIDEIPPEIFPVDVIALCREHCRTVEAARQFLVRYNFFWSGQNLLVHDLHGTSAAFEKTACRVAVRGPNAQGINFITGMGALDPGIRDFQQQMRQKYLDQQGVTWDSADGCFWTQSQGQWDNLARYVDALSPEPTFEGLKALLERRDPSGPMCLTGERCHPDLRVGGCTLVMDIWLMDEKTLHRRQWRGTTPAYLDRPEIVRFT